MKTVDILLLSTRMFKTRPMRTFLTILGVSIGIGTVLFLVGFGYGFQQLILSRIASADELLTLDVSPSPADAVHLTDDKVSAIQNLQQVSAVGRLKNYNAQLTVGTLTSSIQVQAVDEAFLRLQRSRIKNGGAQADQERSALFSTAAVQLFNLTPETALGKTVSVTLVMPGESAKDAPKVIPVEGSYTIAGIVDDENTSFVFLPLKSIPTPVTDVDQLKVLVKSADDLEPAREALIGQGLLVAAISDVIEQANKIFEIVQIVLALFGLVALGVSAIGMFNTMTITLLERTSEIGIMRSIGVRRSDIKKLFLVESMVMGFLGGVGGIIIGMGLGFLANAGINVLARHFGGTSLTLFAFPLWFVVFILIFSGCVGVVTGLYPSHRASHLNPLEALRYK